MATVLHDIPGRVRIRMPGLKANPDVASQVQARMQEMSGVHDAQANPVTGSLIVHYDGTDSARQRILAMLDARPQVPDGAPPSVDVSNRIAEVLCDKLVDFAVRTTLRAIF